MPTVDLSQIGARLRRDSRERRRGVELALFEAALRAEIIVAEDTPVDRARLRNAWDVQKVDEGADLYNDTPYAGAVEAGSRPHWPPEDPIKRWVERVINPPEDEVDGITYAIRKKIAEEGTDPVYMVKDNLERMQAILEEVAEDYLRRGP